MDTTSNLHVANKSHYLDFTKTSTRTSPPRQNSAINRRSEIAQKKDQAKITQEENRKHVSKLINKSHEPETIGSHQSRHIGKGI
jgi:hypothetical protein